MNTILALSTADSYAIAIVGVTALACLYVWSMSEAKKERKFYEEEQARVKALRESMAEPMEEAAPSQETGQNSDSGQELSMVQIFGIIIMTASLVGVVFALTMDTTNGGYHNMGLLNARMTFAILSGFGFVGSLLMMLLGGAKKS